MKRSATPFIAVAWAAPLLPSDGYTPAMRRILLLLVCAAAAWIAAAEGPLTPKASRHAALVALEGPIGPASSGFFAKAKQQAVDGGAALIILRLDTPGGLDTAMRDIIRDILASPIPIVVYVAPDGARAASAGVFLAYAAHIAAMAPASNLGAATPVRIGASPFSGDESKRRRPDPQSEDSNKAKDDKKDDAPGNADGGDAMERKLINDAVAYLRGLAEMRGRNADWAERAVREGASLPASAALKEGVIDLIARDVDDLLQQLDGRTVRLPSGEQRLSTSGLKVETLEPDWRYRFLAVITNPTVAYILMLVGIYGLLLEGYNPGSILPGVTGAICLLLALFAFQALPVNYVGLALMLLGLVLMIAEALAPSFGALGFGGVVGFVLGSILLMDMDVPGFGVNLGIIGGIAVGACLLLGLTLYMLKRSRQAPPTTGDALALNQVIEVIELEPDGHHGWCKLNGERWRVESAAALSAGQRARVRAVRGLTLIVEPE